MPAGARWLMRTAGVLPTVPRMLSYLCFIGAPWLFELDAFVGFSLLFLLEQDIGVEGFGRQVYVVFDLGVEGLTGHVAVVIAGDGEGGGQALHGVVIRVLFGSCVAVFEGGVAPLEGAAAGEVGGDVDVDGDGVVVVAEDGDSFGEAGLDHGAALVDDQDAGSLEPDAIRGAQR